MTEWAYPNPGTPRGRVNSPLHIVRYIMKEQPSFIRSPGGSVGSTLAFLQTISDQTIFCSAVRIPNAPHPFHVFESFQGLLPFVVLDSFMKHFNPQQWVSFQKTHFLLLFCKKLPLISNHISTSFFKKFLVSLSYFWATCTWKAGYRRPGPWGLRV